MSETQPEEPDVVIPEDSDEGESGEDGEPEHPASHRHTPGYPAHHHHGSDLTPHYHRDALAGQDPSLFDEQRHESDSADASERYAATEGEEVVKLGRGLADHARAAGWDVDEIQHPEDPYGVILGAAKGRHRVSISVNRTP